MKVSFAKLGLLLLCLASPWSWAKSNDTEQPIVIHSNNQQVDMKTNTVTFSGKVVLTQGSIKIHADRIVVIRPKGKEGQEIIEAYGKPATFQQTTDDGKPLNGKANKLRYEIAKEFLTMTTNAELNQEGSVIKGDSISYSIVQQKLVAKSGGQERVTTIIQPNKINQK
ncbi:Lipopolysaccharide export system protein LptA [Vibrio stylophorae]|uniref:Lipopolysaccharide export system protein LptA n=1 Tax=Vibrio stylophorae TaxID=659351 RepID=A0ABM8ZQZ4_9VIBR|nr:lipopolysaccharide transport periplasmic protein LptA [Vibrio stylophorae]CAH0532499.1 Lipopolysaccharide export system protein LptA [Vibrio stylophorae]